MGSIPVFLVRLWHLDRMQHGRPHLVVSCAQEAKVERTSVSTGPSRTSGLSALLCSIGYDPLGLQRTSTGCGCFVETARWQLSAAA